MKSNLVKVLHPLMGQPLLAHVLNTARYLTPSQVVVVVGQQADLVEASFSGDDLTFVRQEEQLGTGHAVAMAREVLAGFEGTVLILYGDVPLLSPQTAMDFLAAHRENRVPLSVLTVDLPDPGAYGRVIRDENGYLLRIVEARDATADELAVREINSGIYAADARFLFEAVSDLKADNDQKEYYLTDVVSKARDQNMLVSAVLCQDPEEVLGINDRVQLAYATDYLRIRTNRAWMMAGVTMIDPQTVYIETAVKLAPDVTLWPGNCLKGKTTVDAGATIEPDCLIIDSVVGAGATIGKGSILEGVEVPAGAVIGPMSLLKP